MKIAIVGSGAMGGYYGACMAQAGYEVHFIMRSDYQTVKEKGLTVHSPKGDFHLDQVNCHNRPETAGIVDVVFIGLKTTANDQFETLIRPLAGPETLILSAQNGLGNEERLAELFPSGQVGGGLAFICCNRTEPGVIAHQDYGHIHIGNFNRRPDDRLRRFGDILQDSRIDCQVVDNLALSRWKKLVWNVPFNGLSTLLDLTVDKIVQDVRLKQRAEALMREVQSAAGAWNLNIGDDFLELMMTHSLKMVPYYTSMHLDRLHQRPMEVESIFGEPWRRAEARGVNTPALRELYEALKQLNGGSGRSV